MRRWSPPVSTWEMKTSRTLIPGQVVLSAPASRLAGDDAAGENPGSLDAFERMFLAQ